MRVPKPEVPWSRTRLGTALMRGASSVDPLGTKSSRNQTVWFLHPRRTGWTIKRPLTVERQPWAVGDWYHVVLKFQTRVCFVHERLFEGGSAWCIASAAPVPGGPIHRQPFVPIGGATVSGDRPRCRFDGILARIQATNGGLSKTGRQVAQH